MSFYVGVIFFSFFASLIGMTKKENQHFPLLYFPFFLFLSSVVEFLGDYMSSNNGNNAPLYNFFSVFELTFYLFFFTYLFKQPFIRRAIRIVIPLYFVLTLMNIVFWQGVNNFHTYTYILGCILIVVLSIGYFYFLFRFPEPGKLTDNPYFWIVTGIMFFHACSFSYLGLMNFITKTMQQYTWVLFFVNDLLNVLLYTSFSIAFLWKINIRKSLALS